MGENRILYTILTVCHNLSTHTKLAAFTLYSLKCIHWSPSYRVYHKADYSSYYGKHFNLTTLQISSVIREKGESQNGCFRKTNMLNFPKKEHFLPPDTHTCGNFGKFIGKFDVLCLLETPVLTFALLPYYRRLKQICHENAP